MSNTLDAQAVSTIVDNYLAAVSSADVDSIVSLFSPEAVLEDPVGSDPVSGLDSIRAFYVEGVAGKPTLKRSGPVRVAGNEVAFPFVAQTSMGDIDIIDMFVLDDSGKIASMRAFWGQENFNAKG